MFGGTSEFVKYKPNASVTTGISSIIRIEITKKKKKIFYFLEKKIIFCVSTKLCYT